MEGREGQPDALSIHPSSYASSRARSGAAGLPLPAALPSRKRYPPHTPTCVASNDGDLHGGGVHPCGLPHKRLRPHHVQGGHPKQALRRKGARRLEHLGGDGHLRGDRAQVRGGRAGPTGWVAGSLQARRAAQHAHRQAGTQQRGEARRAPAGSTAGEVAASPAQPARTVELTGFEMIASQARGQ